MGFLERNLICTHIKNFSSWVEIKIELDIWRKAHHPILCLPCQANAGMDELAMDRKRILKPPLPLQILFLAVFSILSSRIGTEPGWRKEGFVGKY